MEITATASIKLDGLTIVAPRPPHSYIAAGENLMPGVAVLAAAAPTTSGALALVAAHVLECVLKAYLTKDGSAAAIAKVKHHDLNKLWSEAVAEGLPVSTSRPDWVDRLSGLHNRPYPLRYSEGVNMLVTPAAEPMAAELAALFDTVRGQLR
jgi:hypothetical protein